MTEAEWLASDDPRPMLNHQRPDGVWLVDASDRKLRLFACACCRRVWRWIPNVDARVAVEVAERFEDGQATLEERKTTLGRVYFGVGWESDVALSASHSDLDDPRYTFSADVQGACHSAQETAQRHGALADEEKAAQAALLRCAFGPTAFRPATVDPGLRTPTVLTLAHAAYDERLLPSGELDRDRLAVLADALEEAGCGDAEILAHLRSAGPHARGCWPLDLLLGKQ